MPKFAKIDIENKLHPRLDFDKKSAYIGVLLCPLKMADIPIRHIIGFNKDLNQPTAIPQESYPSSPLEEELLRNRKVDSSYRRWKHSDSVNFLEGNTRVEPEKLFNDIVMAYKRYCYFESETTYHLLALWVMGTYLFPLFPAYPLILLNGLKGTGKSRTCSVSACMAFNARLITDPSTASLIRFTHNQRSSVFVDDAEFLASKAMTRFFSTLKSSYKPTAKIARVGKNKDGSIDEYEIYSPKMFNNISGIADVIGSRSIIIRQTRAPAHVKIEKHDPVETDECWFDIRNRLYLFTFNYWQDIKTLLPEQKELPLHARPYELYAGVLSIAQFIDSVSEQKGLHKLILDAAMQDAEERESKDLKATEYDLQNTPKALAIRALLTIVQTDGWYSCEKITSAIKKIAPFPETITSVKTAKLIKDLGFAKTKNVDWRRTKGAVGSSVIKPTEYLIKRLGVIYLARKNDISET